jgi:hypothetical protein
MNVQKKVESTGKPSSAKGTQIQEIDKPTHAFDPSELEFPFHDDVRPGESGQGHALRMAAENHLSGLHQLKSWLGKSRFATLDASDARQLQRWFGANRAHLEHALGWTATGRCGQKTYAYAGQTLARSYFLNRSHPRVCTLCLQENGHCLSAWDFTLNVACPKHHAPLSDACGYCTRSITWNRPGPLTCNCHFDLDTLETTSLTTTLEIQFAAWVDRCVASKLIPNDEIDQRLSSRVNAPEDSTPLMRLVWPLSLNGGMAVTYALATAAGYEDSTPSGEPRVRSPLKKAQQALLRADQIARKIDQLDGLQLLVQRPSVVIQLLADCMTGQAPTADRNLAHSLLCTVLHQRRKARWSGVNPQLSQLTLF